MKVTLELTPKQLQEIKTTYNLVDKAPQEPVFKGRPKPNIGDKYWFITASGDICYDFWSNGVTDNLRYKIGNVYYSEAEAEFALEKQLVTQELKDFALVHNERKLKWKSGNIRYYIYLSDYSLIPEIKINNTWHSKFSDTVYFTSREIAKQAIEEIGADRLIKYYFGEWEDANE